MLMDVHLPQHDRRCQALRAELEWMVAALDAAKRYEARCLALIGLIRATWCDAQVLALAHILYPDQSYPNRATAMGAIELYPRQHSRLLVELLLAEPRCDSPPEAQAKPFRAS